MCRFRESAISALKTKGISANTMVADYDGMTVDFMRWFQDTGYYKGSKVIMLHKYYPPWSEDDAITKFNHKLETFPWSWIGKRTKKSFLSTSAYLPQEWEKLIHHRYKLSFWTTIPYKWKCYVPCFMYNKDPSCKKH